MSGKTFNVGIVGYGASAKIFHIPFLTQTPQFKLYSIVQRSPKEGNSAPNDYPDIKHYTDYKQLFADPAVDLVVIGTPPGNHFELTKAALEAGKHVLTEKPFVPTSAEADKLIDIAKKSGKLLTVYQNRRWDNDFVTVKKLVSEGTLGRIIQFDTHFDRYKAVPSNNWKLDLTIAQGGSALFDLGTHLIDQAYTLFGKPQAVHGRLLNQRSGKFDFENPDGVSAELTYPDGLLVNIRISVLSAEIDQPRFWLRGTKGSFRKLGLDPQEDQLHAGKKATEADFGKDDPKNLKLVLVGDDGVPKEQAPPTLEPLTYKAFYAQLAKAVESGKEEDVPVSATDARDVLRIIEGVFESAKTGKDVTLA
ncbi:oxidoreductase [Fusarium albosuccineum]|uniref:Oxidoreductase n=1 Tax=Fusarium albosuccineum TaxID=1237068 RepID=A0A8H4LJK7_9HYPO|nr:oxidoreductase [Fusarium albosuccineum]